MTKCLQLQKSKECWQDGDNEKLCAGIARFQTPEMLSSAQIWISDSVSSSLHVEPLLMVWRRTSFPLWCANQSNISPYARIYRSVLQEKKCVILELVRTTITLTQQPITTMVSLEANQDHLSARSLTSCLLWTRVSWFIVTPAQKSAPGTCWVQTEPGVKTPFVSELIIH